MQPRLDRRAFAKQLLAALGVAQAPSALAQAFRYGSIARRESQYATTYVDRDGKYLTMRFGVNKCLFTESRYNPRDPTELPLVYTRYMTVALAYAPRAARVVDIGLGGGRIASYIHDFIPEARVTCIELDPAVVELAQRYFGVKPGPRLELVTLDGRVYMARSTESFDLILVDAYQGTLVPFHLVTREFYAILQRRLAPGGVVVQNIMPSVLDLDRMVATARAVFPNVDLYRAGGNWVLVAHDGAARSDAELRNRALALQQAHALRYPLEPMLAQRRAGVVASERPFTDDFAPVGYGDYDRQCRAGGG
ncbi:MAG TPA: fused MFS/spermidine synthase [Steroidobacteraceae bacterium]|nr:fused MFS/spermidine synthase [Steroidobacteraceae bacterium]